MELEIKKSIARTKKLFFVFTVISQVARRELAKTCASQQIFSSFTKSHGIHAVLLGSGSFSSST